MGIRRSTGKVSEYELESIMQRRAEIGIKLICAEQWWTVHPWAAVSFSRQPFLLRNWFTSLSVQSNQLTNCEFFWQNIRAAILLKRGARVMHQRSCSSWKPINSNFACENSHCSGEIVLSVWACQAVVWHFLGHREFHVVREMTFIFNSAYRKTTPRNERS